MTWRCCRKSGCARVSKTIPRVLSGRAPGSPPFTLLDYFPDDFLLIVDESHVTLPQVRGMFAGDRGRKKNLVDFGFRLPSAYDNRPLNFEEFESHIQSGDLRQRHPRRVRTGAQPRRLSNR